MMAHELGAREEPRHADHDDHRDHRRRHLDARQFRLLLRRRPRQQQPARLVGVLVAVIVAPIAAHAGADGDQPHARICRRPRRRRDLRPAAGARLGARQDRDGARRMPRTRRRAQSGDRASLHHQSAVRRADGQPVLDPSGDREPHRRAAGSMAGEIGGRGRAARARAAAPRRGSPPRPWRRRPRAGARPVGLTAERRRSAAPGRQTARPPAPGLAARASRRPSSAGVLDGSSRSTRCSTRRRRRRFRALAPRDRALARAIVATALRRHGEIDAALGALHRKRPPRAPASSPHPRGRRGADPLPGRARPRRRRSSPSTRSPPTATRAHFKGLANAVLRRLARERRRDPRGARRRARLRHAGLAVARAGRAPMARRPRAAIAAAHLVEPALDLTVKADPEGWARTARRHRPADRQRPPRAERRRSRTLPGFAEGEWWVQDAAAALAGAAARRRRRASASPISAPRPAARRPQLAAAGAHVTAVDISADAPAAASRTTSRGSSSRAEIVAADVSTWRPAEPFDAVLLDAPCTATGTIRRHPDIAWLKRPEDIAALAGLQAPHARPRRRLAEAGRHARLSAPARSSRRKARPSSRAPSHRHAL